MLKSSYFQLSVALGAMALCLAEDIQPPPVNAATELAKATLPTARQLAWQQREVEALIHFGVYISPADLHEPTYGWNSAQSISEQSVGRNAGQQLNNAPDRSGRIPDADVERLKEFGETLQSYFASNLCTARGSTVEKEKGQGETPLKQTVSWQDVRNLRECGVLSI